MRDPTFNRYKLSYVNTRNDFADHLVFLRDDIGRRAMLMVKTKLGLSSIEGIGLFADEDIKAATITWRFIPGFDQLFSQAEIDTLAGNARGLKCDQEPATVSIA